MAIFSATSWQDGVFWHLTINTSLSTSPGSVSVDDSSGVNSFPVTSFSAGVINVTVKTFDQFFEVIVPGETKRLPFGAEPEEDATQDGVILAPSGKSLSRPYLTLPFCDLAALEVRVFLSTGEEVIIQSATKTQPLAVLYSAPSEKVIAGITVPALQVVVDGSYQAVEGGAWVSITTLQNYRVEISGVQRSASNQLISRLVPDSFYGKKFYALFA